MARLRRRGVLSHH